MNGSATIIDLTGPSADSRCESHYNVVDVGRGCLDRAFLRLMRHYIRGLCMAHRSSAVNYSFYSISKYQYFKS
jgi:hypothetical protein